MKNKVIIMVTLLSLFFICLLSASAEEMELRELEIDEVVKDIEIDVSGAEIIFDETSDKVYFSEDLKIKRSGDRLYIRTPIRNFISIFGEKDYKLIIGTQREYSSVEIDAGGAIISGVLHAKRIEVDGGGFEVDNAWFFAEKISFDGGGLSVNGQMQTKYLSVDGGGMSLDIKLIGTKRAEFDGAGIGAEIKYLDSWTGNRYLSFEGVGGDVEVIVPKENGGEDDGKLLVDKDGLLDIDINYY